MSDETPVKEENSESDPEENQGQPHRSLALDLGDDCLHNVDTNRLGSQGHSGGVAGQESSSSSGSTTKREDNPFSFKHFLRDNSSSNKNYQSLGARPKIYRESRSRHVTPPESPQRTSQQPKKIKEFSSALPDFVQDHLVIEQCFLGSKTPSFNLDLPDFAQGDQSFKGPNVSRSNSIENPLIGPIPLDLPGLSVGNAFPLDLPVGPNVTQANTTPLVEVGNSKSLPDFLTDGPVRSNADNDSPPASVGEMARCHRCLELTAELSSTRLRLSHVEDDVERNYRRASAADNIITRLKQELKALKSQNRHLHAENQALRDGDRGATGGGEDPPLQMQAQRLSRELRVAASTAEHSLRSLLTGVDNLRMMASTLENLNRIEEKPSDMFSRFDDDSAGPAL